ncbi:MAG: hypothetical protein V3R84_04285 [Acidimicrobiia bacterium]
MKDKSRLRAVFALVAVLTLIASACGDSSEETTAPTAAPATTLPDFGAADFNGDGKVLIAMASTGQRDDGAYNEALVTTLEEIATAGGYEDILIVDEIDPAEGRAELDNIVAQNPDIVALVSSVLADGNEDIFLEHEEIFWYCNCGSGYQDVPGLLRSTDSGGELSISGGYATGLLMQEAGGDSAVFIGCCDLGFEVEWFNAWVLGIQQVDVSFTATYVPTGTFPFDFANTAGATEAYNTAVAAGADAIYPFLDGAHEAIVQLANEDGLIVMTAGQSNGCERDDVDYSLEIKFDAGDYIADIFDEILSGALEEGGARKFTVGVDPQVGGELCNATAEQVQMLEDFNQRVGAGEFADLLFEIAADAYGF